MDEDREYLFRSATLQAQHDTVANAARDHGLNRTTLQGRIDGAVSIHAAKEVAQRLSNDQERELVEWILQEEAAGRAPSHGQIRGFAQLMISCAGDEEPIGHNWVPRFIERNLAIKTKPSREIEAVRTRATTKEKLKDHIDRVDHMIKTKSVSRGRIYNVDEHGIAEGATNAGRVVGTSITSYSAVSASDSRAWISIIECVGAGGNRLTPCVVFTGLNLQGQWFPERDIPKWAYECTPSGWSNTRVFQKWFLRVFLEETRPQDRSLWRILILDGHKSHVTIEIMYLAWLNKVQLIYLPAHSSHISQPLDVGLFSPLKSYFYIETREFASFNTTAPIQKQRFIIAYKVASEKAFSSRNIRSGFRATGIWPTNADRVIDQVVEPEQPPATIAPPQTPQKRKFEHPDVWMTPKSSRDLNSLVDLLHEDLDDVHRDLCEIFRKIGKGYERKNGLITALIKRNEFLEKKEASRKPIGRKAVDYNPNESFASIPEIASARYEAAIAQSHFEEVHGPNLYKEAMEIARMEKEKMYIQWQL